MTAVAGIITFADKIISEEYSNQLKEWIRMTKVGRLFEEEKQEAVKKKAAEVTAEVTAGIARKLKASGMDIKLIAETTGLSEAEIEIL